MADFISILECIERLAIAEKAINVAEEHALEKSCKIIQKQAKKNIGHLQPSIGPFQDWAELAQSTKDYKEKHGFVFNKDYNPLLMTGELMNSIEYEVKGHEAVVGSKMEIAAFQEFGTIHIPPRPFIGPAYYANKEKIQELIGHALIEGLALNHIIHSSLGYNDEF